MTGNYFWKYFRIIFLIFSLYLLGDAFYYWDGFSKYGTFSEFIPSVALVSIFWSILAVLITVLVWTVSRSITWLCKAIGWELRDEQLFTYQMIFILLGGVVWTGKKILWPYETAIQIKIIAFICVAVISVFLIRSYSNKAEKCVHIVQERITPLVWLFILFVVLSVPIVSYHISWKQFSNGATGGVVDAEDSVKNRPNIILVTFDALTARDMSLYGYDRLTTPFISEWANTASVFMRVEAAGNFTGPTSATLMTGKRVWTHRRFSPFTGAKPVKSEVENLAFELKKNNYFNMAFVSNPLATIDALGMSKSFDISLPYTEFSDPVMLTNIIRKYLYHYIGSNIKFSDWIVADKFILSKILMKLSPNYFTTRVPPEKAFKMFFKTLNNKSMEPFFAWIHIFPPHDPYLPPLPYMGLFDPSTEMKTYKEQQGPGWASDDDFPNEFRSKVDIFRARYDEFIRYCDIQFEDFIIQLEKENKLDNTIVILSADHGESFEHDYISHGGIHLYEQVTHIPLVIKKPGQHDKQIIDSLVGQADIAVTILDLAGISKPVWMDGRSLVPLLNNENILPRPVLSMAVHLNNSQEGSIKKGTFAVWEGDYKLIHYLEANRSMLFNLRKDPDELDNLIEIMPELGQRLLSVIKEKLDETNNMMKQGEQ